MYNRPLHPRPVSLPRNIVLPPPADLPYENMFHSPGQNAAIRFFDPHSVEDLQAMREILKGKQVKRWMDNTHQMSQSEYREWAGSRSDTSFLFAVHDARVNDPKAVAHVHGFIYLYSEREEKFRVRRMEKFGFLNQPTRDRYALEVSFAVRPQASGIQAGSGLMSSALRQSCLQVQMLLTAGHDCEVVIFGFVDPENYSAQRTLEASGFVKKGQMKYDWNSDEETYLYILNWRILKQKVKDKLLESLKMNGLLDGV